MKLFGWYDMFNECLYRDKGQAGCAIAGGNKVIDLYTPDEPVGKLPAPQAVLPISLQDRLAAFEGAIDHAHRVLAYPEQAVISNLRALAIEAFQAGRASLSKERG